MKNNISLQVSLKVDTYEKANKNASEKQVCVEKYIEDLVEDSVSLIKLTKGFIYKPDEKKLYSPKGVQINLTRREEKILDTLVKNPNQVVPLEAFFKTVWSDKTNKETILFSLRNFIKSIRDKTDYDLIKSISGIGYSIEYSA